MDGVLVVDKPAGVGSTDVVRAVRRAARQKKVGHTGTLDPDATGVLVVCLGRATRLVRFLQEGEKTYEAEMVLGVETSTQDLSGSVQAEKPAEHVDETLLCDTLQEFVGDLEQVPPMVSAVKVGGERLYERARRGEEIEREPRRVTVHDLVLESFEPGEQARATFVVVCSSGTYVRTLCHDVGRALRCGAALARLRRVANGPFTLADAHPLDEVERRGEEGGLEEIVLPLVEAVRGMPRIEVDPDAAFQVATGRPLAAAGMEGPYAVVLRDPRRLLAVYVDRDGEARPEAVLVQPPDLRDITG
jgi:tRNA pseudouridine55 synthase